MAGAGAGHARLEAPLFEGNVFLRVRPARGSRIHERIDRRGHVAEKIRFAGHFFCVRFGFRFDGGAGAAGSISMASADRC